MYNKEVMKIQNLGKTSSKITARILTNKILLKNLEKISEHGTSFSAGTSLALSLTLRPFSILTTPNTEKENKQYAAANSISSGIMKFAIVESIALPVEYAIKNIDENPEKFLKKSTINNLKGSTELINSRSYKLITQIIKLSTGALTAIPKSMLTVALIPIVMDKLFFKNRYSEKKTNTINNSSIPNFTGHLTEKLSTKLGKLINNKSIQNFAKRFEHNDKNIAKHMSAGTDVLLTGSAIYQVNKSDKIKNNRKKALIYNNVISTGITLFGGYGIDKLLQKKTGKFIEHFKHLNAHDAKLNKYIEGINILRPALIFAGIYYGVLPIFSTFLSDKIDKYIQKSNNKN